MSPRLLILISCLGSLNAFTYFRGLHYAINPTTKTKTLQKDDVIVLSYKQSTPVKTNHIVTLTDYRDDSVLFKQSSRSAIAVFELDQAQLATNKTLVTSVEYLMGDDLIRVDCDNSIITFHTDAVNPTLEALLQDFTVDSSTAVASPSS
jgi:hypothetical protein